jgi:hypothetical protein
MLTAIKPNSTILKTILCVLCLSASPLASVAVQADEATSPQFDVSRSSADNLLHFKGKIVAVTTTSGQTVTGNVKEVKNGMLHLERLAQKEYYDSVIMLEQICSIEARVRNSL